MSGWHGRGEELEMETGFVYLMKPVGHNVYKIGQTVNIENRIARKEKVKDYKLKCVCAVEVDRVHMWRIEHDLHNMFHSYRLAGEWFVLPKEIIKQFVSIVRDVEKIYIGARAYTEG